MKMEGFLTSWEKNEAIIAKSPLPLPFPLWVLSSQYETHHIILL